jgi:hypothetical protein
MTAPADNDRDDALLRRLYDEPDADCDGELAREVESYRRVRGAIADYARATEVEPPARGVDELLAAARQRAVARPAAVAPEAIGFWARLRAWLAPIAAHPALASAAMVVLVAGVAGVLYVKGKTKVSESQVGAPAVERTGAGSGPSTADHGPAQGRGMVAGLDDGGQGSAAAPNEALPREEGPHGGTETAETTPKVTPTPSKPPKDKIKRPRPRPEKTAGAGGGGSLEGEGQGDDFGADNVAIGEGRVVTDSAGNAAPVIEPSVPAAAPPGSLGTNAPTSAPSRDELLIAGENIDAASDAGADVGKSGGNKAPQKADEQNGPKLDQLTRQARTAAKAGDCTVVKSIGGRVKKANAAYYKQTFATDATIKKCL